MSSPSDCSVAVRLFPNDEDDDVEDEDPLEVTEPRTVRVKSDAEQHFEKKGRLPSVLLAMCIGSRLEQDLNADPWSKYSLKKEIRMKKDVLKAECKRRVKQQGLKERVPNSHNTVKDYVAYLRKYPNLCVPDLVFIAGEMEKYRAKVVAMVNTANNGMPADQRRWIGIDPWLRLYHVIDELKDKFVQRDVSYDRQELDRPDKTNFWDDASALFNDPEYKPWTYKLSWLHSEFNASFQIEKEKCPSNVNGEQLKKKLAEARMKLLRVMDKWERSGNGDGMPNPEDPTQMIVGSDRAAFLGHDPVHILYLWHLAEHNDTLNSIKAMLPPEMGVSSENIPSVRNGKKVSADSSDIESGRQYRTSVQKSMEDIAESMKNANLIKAHEALGRYEILHAEAIAEDRPASICAIYKKKVEMISKQIVAMGGTLD